MTSASRNDRDHTPALVHVGRTLRGLLLWEYDRGSWQYDLMVVLILIFVFATPAVWFDDQPDFLTLSQGPGGDQYRVRARLLRRYDADFREEPRPAARRLFLDRLDHPFTITAIKEVRPGGAGKAVWYDVTLRREE